MKLKFTRAVRKERVSWVLRREVCTWFGFATCTQTTNEGNTNSEEKIVIIPRNTFQTGGCKTTAQYTQASSGRQQGALCCDPRRNP